MMFSFYWRYSWSYDSVGGAVVVVAAAAADDDDVVVMISNVHFFLCPFLLYNETYYTYYSTLVF